MADKTIVLYVARHGRTEMNEANVFRGNSDPSLDANGFRDASELAYYFTPIDLSFIVASSKKRSLTTAETIYLAKKIEADSPFDLKPVANDLLFPWNIGPEFQGKPKNEENVAKLQKYISSPDLSPPSGDSLNDFRGKIRPLLWEAVEFSNRAGVPGLLVVHSSVMHEVGEVFGGHTEAAHVKPGGVAAVYVDQRTGVLGVEPIFKPDARSTSQNIFGKSSRAGLNS